MLMSTLCHSGGFPWSFPWSFPFNFPQSLPWIFPLKVSTISIKFSIWFPKRFSRRFLFPIFKKVLLEGFQQSMYQNYIYKNFFLRLQILSIHIIYLFIFAINPNPLPWSHFCQNNFIFLFKGWNKCQKNLGKFDFYFFYI